jgi:hypothetical protein
MRYVRQAIACIDAARLPGEARRETALACGVQCYARHSVASIFTPVAHVRLRLCCVRLRLLLPGKRTLFTRLLDLLAPRRALRRRKPA